MKINDIFSVIIPVYNAEKFIERSINSIIRQTYKNWELILINDGSQDNSEDIIKNIISIHSDLDIKYKSIKNSGPSTARNLGLEMANGKYVCFLDADDEYREDLFESITKINKDFDVCYFGWKDNLNKKYLDDFKYIDDLNGKDAVIKKFNREIWLCNCNEVYKTDFLKLNKITYPEGVYSGEDACFIYSALMVADKVICLEDDFFINYVREDSLMHCKFTDKNLTEFTAIEKIIEFIQQTSKLNITEKEKFVNMFNAYYDYVKISIAKKISKEYKWYQYFRYRKFLDLNLNDCKINLKLIKKYLNKNFYIQGFFFKISKFLFFIICRIKYGR